MDFLIDEKPHNLEFLAEIIEELKQEKTIKNNQKVEYYNISAAFDIETSSFYEDGDKRAIMYGWTFGVMGRVILGRTWKEFVDVLNTLHRELGLHPAKRLVIYVQNLGYEFQFMRKFFEWVKVFAVKERSPVYALTGGIEFRCSYILSGYNLENMGKNLIKYPVQKMVGDLDYKLVRHSKTNLTEKEMGYMVHDVLVVMSYIMERIEIDGDITQIPMTKTGYVRNHCRKACYYENESRKSKSAKNRYYRYRELMRDLTITPQEYMQLKRAFQGGFTHASAWKSGKVLDNVGSFDFKSSYPAVMVAEKFPMSRAEIISDITLDDFEKSMKLYCCVFDIEFINIRESVLTEHPISISRCRQTINAVTDNGRLVEADHIITTMTECDYMMAKLFYNWDGIKIHNFRRYKKGYLPKAFVESILQMYKDKTELDGVDPVNYARSKTMINAAFGMIVTDICRDDYKYDTNWSTVECDVDIAIKKYNNSASRFLFYPWGVWVTAYARRNLLMGIYAFGSDYVYSDTDSIKAINCERHYDYITAYNQDIVTKLDKALEHHGLDPDMSRPRTRRGIQKQLGIWDFEGTYTKFKTLGAKRYMVLTEEKGLSLTVSGLNKRTVIPYMMRKYNEDVNSIFAAFAPDLDIDPEYTGKNTHTYIDWPTSGIVTDYLGNTERYSELSCVHLESAPYQLSLSKEYADFLRGLKTEFD